MATKRDGADDRAQALAATEARLGVRFPDDYRAFVLDRPSYHVMVKHIRLHAVERCARTGGDQAVAIGEAFFDGHTELVFKAQRRRLSDIVYELQDGRYTRRPRFAELVARDPGGAALSNAPELRLAERLAGFARRCPCGREVRVGELCSCMRVASKNDPAYELSVDELAAARAELPHVVLAAELARDLKTAGHAVPAGPKQLAAAALVLQSSPPADAAPRLLATWRDTGMSIDLDEATLTAAIERRATT